MPFGHGTLKSYYFVGSKSADEWCTIYVPRLVYWKTNSDTHKYIYLGRSSRMNGQVADSMYLPNDSKLKTIIYNLLYFCGNNINRGYYIYSLWTWRFLLFRKQVLPWLLAGVIDVP